MSSVSGNPQNPGQRVGAIIVVADSTALAALDPSGLTLGSEVYKTDDDSYWELKVSSAALGSTVIAVNGISGLRWLLRVAAAGFVTLAQLADTSVTSGATLVGVNANGGMFSEPDLQHVLQEDVVLKANLAATDGTGGASLVGIQDVGNYYTATAVEGALQETGATNATQTTNIATNTTNIAANTTAIANSLVFIATQTVVGSAAANVTFSGLVGDTDGDYYFEGHMPAAAAGNLELRPNGSTSNLRSMLRGLRYSGSGTPTQILSDAATGQIGLTPGSTTEFTTFRGYFRGRRNSGTKSRTAHVWSETDRSGNADSNECTVYWDEETTSLTSLVFASNATNAFGVGCSISLWKLPAAPV